MTKEEATQMMLDYKTHMQKVENFGVPAQDPTELMTILGEANSMKPYLSFALFKVLRKALTCNDLATIKVLVEQSGLDFTRA